MVNTCSWYKILKVQKRAGMQWRGSLTPAPARHWKGSFKSNPVTFQQALSPMPSLDHHHNVTWTPISLADKTSKTSSGVGWSGSPECWQILRDLLLFPPGSHIYLPESSKAAASMVFSGCLASQMCALCPVLPQTSGIFLHSLWTMPNTRFSRMFLQAWDPGWCFVGVWGGIPAAILYSGTCSLNGPMFIHSTPWPLMCFK